MPELPEVETVRRGLAEFVVGATLCDVAVLSERTARHCPGGAAQLQARLEGRTIVQARRRGKFMWFPLLPAGDDWGVVTPGWRPDEALVVHLGMSGQMLIKQGPAAQVQEHPHVRARARLRYDKAGADGDRGAEAPRPWVGERQLWFVDQRTFGYWRLSSIDPDDAAGVPDALRHIAVDLLDPAVDLPAVAGRLKASHREIKTLLLGQEIVSGIGNIYADEMLWEAAIHPRQRAHRLSTSRLLALLQAGQEVMSRAIAVGGTSFDDLYVNVNGQSGYFDRSLHAYGQVDRPCERCGAALVKEVVGGRSSHFCPQCQRRH